METIKVKGTAELTTFKIVNSGIQNPKDSEAMGNHIQNLLNAENPDRVTVKSLIHNVDFNLLKQQIGAIYKAQTALTAIGGKENMDIVENLDGIVQYLDSMRDIAVDVYDYEENVVLDLSDTDNRNEGQDRESYTDDQDRENYTA